MKDFVPDSFKNLRDWAQKILDNIDAIATRIGWTALLAAFKTRVTNLRDQAQAVLDAQAALDTAIGQLDAAKETDLPEIRQDIANLKTTRGFNDGDAKTLDVATTGGSLDPSTYQPGLNVEEKKGRNEIMAKKLGATASTSIRGRPAPAPSNSSPANASASRSTTTRPVPTAKPRRANTRSSASAATTNSASPATSSAPSGDRKGPSLKERPRPRGRSFLRLLRR